MEKTKVTANKINKEDLLKNEDIHAFFETNKDEGYIIADDLKIKAKAWKVPFELLSEIASDFGLLVRYPELEISGASMTNFDEEFEEFIKEDDSDDTPVSTKRSKAENEFVDGTHYYLKMIGEWPLLTREEESDLGAKIQRGQKAREENEQIEAKLQKNPNAENAENLHKKFQANQKIINSGNIAKDTLTERNLRLVVSIAKKFHGNHMTFDDLIQEGSFGLMTAASRFDPTKGFKFSTYATWWIRQSIIRGLSDKDRTIRLPVHMVEMVNKINAATTKLEFELQRQPTNEEISAVTGLSIDDIKSAKFNSALHPTSLDKPISQEEDESTLGDFIESVDLSPEEIVESNMLRGIIAEILNNERIIKNERTRDIINHRFGLNGCSPMTLEELGHKYGLSRERIRQIEHKTLKLIYSNKKARELLKDYNL